MALRGSLIVKSAADETVEVFDGFSAETLTQYCVLE
jgi:hypothetical protein